MQWYHPEMVSKNYHHLSYIDLTEILAYLLHIFCLLNIFPYLYWEIKRHVEFRNFFLQLKVLSSRKPMFIAFSPLTPHPHSRIMSCSICSHALLRSSHQSHLHGTLLISFLRESHSCFNPAQAALNMSYSNLSFTLQLGCRKNVTCKVFWPLFQRSWGWGGMQIVVFIVNSLSKLWLKGV